jgi:NADPH-dependent 2,4-dienoyl-CoA reductase/sulfur reductase-like enzyme
LLAGAVREGVNRKEAAVVAGTTHVIIVGGGFAGIACAHRLAGRSGIQVTLLDQRGFHQFTPLLYQVATAELAPADVRFDLARRFHRHDNIRVRTAEVTTADPHGHQVTLAGGELIPVWRELLFDVDTAVTAFAKLRQPPFAFLLESVVGGEKWARYTFLGTEPASAGATATHSIVFRKAVRKRLLSSVPW